MKQRAFESAGDKESPYLCRGCGYNTTDQERKLFGQIHKDEEGNIDRQYHWCTFCGPYVDYPVRIFQRLGDKIQAYKTRVKDQFWSNHKLLKRVNDLMAFEQMYYTEIHNAPYQEDENGVRVYNKHEEAYLIEFECLKNLASEPRRIYLELLEDLGGHTDEPPCTRNLSRSDQKKLLTRLRNESRLLARQNKEYKQCKTKNAVGHKKREQSLESQISLRGIS
jgi:hypothetical protein